MATNQSAEVIPDLRDERVQPDGSAVCIQGVSVLVDLVVQHTNGAPEGWVAAVPIYSLLICFVCLGILLLGHVAPAKQVPALSVAVVFARSQYMGMVNGGCGNRRPTCSDRLLQKLNRLLLAGKTITLLVMQPAQLLQNLGVVRVSVQYTLVCVFGTVKILLLLVHMTDLEPDVLFGQRRWR